MIRTCNICGITNATAEFYAGVTSRCKSCHRAKVKQNRQDKADYYKTYDAIRFQNDPKVRERHRRYQATDKGKASMLQSRLKWLEANQDKRAAHVLLGNAVRDGRVMKPKSCQICAAGGRIDGHHDDYTKPLDVIWCCRKCHIEIHRNLERKIP